MHTKESENERLYNALQASGIGTWSISPETAEIYPDTISRSLFNIPQDNGITFTEIFAQVHPEDKALVESVIHKTLLSEEEASLNIKYRIFSHKGTVNWLQLKGKKYSTESLFGTVQDVTDEIEQNAYTSQSEDRLRTIIDEAPIAISLYVSRKLIVGIANDIMLSYWGKDKSIIGKSLEEAVPELDGQPFLKILDNIFVTGETYQVIEEPAKLALNGMLDVYYFDFTYKPLFNDEGKVYAIMNMAVNVTDRVNSRRKIQESESRFRAIIDQSPMAIGFLNGKDFTVELGNDKIFEVWGKTRAITGMPIMEALPEIKGQGFIELLEKVYNTGETYRGYDVLAKLEHNGVIKDTYFDFSYSPLNGSDGNSTGVLVLATDVSQRIQDNRKVAESEAKFRALINAAPAAMAVFKGRDLIIDITNQAFLDIIGRDKTITGKPLLEVMPELKGQESIKLMQDVFDTAKKSHSYARQVFFMKNGVMTNNYYNVGYTPLTDSNGEVYAILDTAIDVTESIKSKQAIEEAEASLRGAIELANLGTWNLDPNTSKLSYSDRIAEWFGLTGDTDNVDEVINVIHPDDQNRIINALAAAFTPGSNGLYNEEYRVKNNITGSERILHAQGKAFFDEKGIAYIMIGTAQDITPQKKIQLALENEVKLRTTELQKANFELEEANRRLINSNEELAQYAYVASHDLQEPLRKIAIFSNLLRERDTKQEYKATIDKIVNSSQRMSLLIKDLLEFSRLLNPDIHFVSTNVDDIVKAVTNDFELLIEEKKAKLSVDNLPVIEAVPLQMNQLFYNLIGNALKFVPEGKAPEILIKCEKVDREEAIALHNYMPGITYYRFSVIDNGIGIDEKYVKQIFEVFKRLHAKNEYSGSGIGLAICRRIVNNHAGSIYVESKSGEGTAFHIILPEKHIM